MQVGRARLVDRVAEVAALEEALLAASRGEGQLVAVTGEAGMGKSRLAAEVRDWATQLGWATLSGGCAETAPAVPYLPVVESLGNWLASVSVDEVRVRLGSLARELAQLFPQLHPEPVRPDGADAEQARLRLFEAIVALLRLAGEGRGLLLVVEDVHWADSATRDLLDYLSRRLREARALLVVTYRADELHRRHPMAPLLAGWRRGGLARTVSLPPLDAVEVAALVADVFDSDIVSAELGRFLCERADGNPFVVEEMVAEAVERGDIYQTATGWERKELAQFQVPATVADGVLARLDRLDSDHRDVIAAAAVLGRGFDPLVVAVVAGATQQRTDEALRAAGGHHLVEVDPGAPGRSRFRFRHALTREAVLDDLSLWRRLQLHAAAADALADGEPVELARHLLAAGRTDQAVPACLAAADFATGQAAYLQAAEFYQTALPHIADSRTRARTMCLLGEALADHGDRAGALPWLEEGVGLLEAAGDAVLAASHRLTLGRCRGDLGHAADCQTDLNAALAVLVPLGPSEALARGLAYAAGMSCSVHDGPEGERLARQAIEVATAVGTDRFRLMAYDFLGWALVS